MTTRVATCRVCATGFILDHDPLPPCHAFDHFAVEELNLQIHAPDWQCMQTHCEWHGVDESHVGAYRICGGCGHVYKTPAVLIAAQQLTFGSDLAEEEFGFSSPIASNIMHCPLCSRRLVDPRPANHLDSRGLS